MLGQLLQRQGIRSVILECKGQEHVVQRQRAGVLEQPTVDLLRAAGVGERLDREGLMHTGLWLQFQGQRHRIALE